jgi:hypothetical protein
VQEEFQDRCAVVDQSGFEFTDAFVAAGPGRLVDKLVHPRDQHVLVVGSVENRHLPQSWRMRMHPPEEIMGELQRCGLFEADDRGALRIECAEHVVHSTVFATGI